MPYSQIDDDSCEVIRHEPKITRLDKARLKCDQLADQHEQLSAIADPSPEDRRKLTIIEASIARARQRYQLENKRAADDTFRRNEAVDAWRNENKELYNAMRRKVRIAPNANLSEMTEAAKVQHVRDQKADSKWKAARRAKGWSEDQIAAAFEIRVRERADERARLVDMKAQALF